MKTDLQLRLTDQELTLSDGTALRLALPGPTPRRSRAPWLFIGLTLALAAYLGWWSQQPWLFIQGPTLISQQTPAGLAPLLCQRLTDDLGPHQGASDPWLPAPAGGDFKGRCLDGALTLETLMAKGLIFMGAPVPVLAMDAIATEHEWTLRARLNGEQLTANAPLAHELTLLPSFQRLALGSVNPVFAAQSQIAEGAYDAALASLAVSHGPEADLTRARALYLAQRRAEAWQMYEGYDAGEYQGLVRIALARIAADDGNTESALTMLESAHSSDPQLRVDVALGLGQVALAQQWIDAVEEPAQWPLRAQIAAALGQHDGVIAALSQLPSQQLSSAQRTTLAGALRMRARYEQARALIADVDSPGADLVRAQLQFDRGDVDAALRAAAAIELPAARNWAAQQWAWDNQPANALGLIRGGDDASHALRFEALLGLDNEAAEQAADAMGDDVSRAWSHGRLALARGDTTQATAIQQRLASLSPDHANHLGALINTALGFDEDAAISLRNLSKTAHWSRHRFIAAAQLGQATRSQLSAGEQRLARVVTVQVEYAMAHDDAAVAAQLARAQLQARDDAPGMALWLARAYRSQGLNEAALDSYNQLDLARGDAEQAAQLAHELGAFDRVSSWLAPHATQLSKPAQGQLLNAWIETQQTDAAEAWIRSAVVRAPDDAQLYVYWGQVAEGSGDLIGAISKYRQAARLAPDFGPAHLAWALALEQRGERNAAFKRMAQASGELSDDQWIAKADFYTRAEYPDLAAQALDQADIGVPALRLKVAALQAAQGLNHAAHESFSAAMSDAVEDPALWRTWGDSLAALGQTTEALDKYKVAVRLSR